MPLILTVLLFADFGGSLGWASKVLMTRLNGPKRICLRDPERFSAGNCFERRELGDGVLHSHTWRKQPKARSLDMRGLKRREDPEQALTLPQDQQLSDFMSRLRRSKKGRRASARGTCAYLCVYACMYVMCMSLCMSACGGLSICMFVCKKSIVQVLVALLVSVYKRRIGVTMGMSSLFSMSICISIGTRTCISIV